MGSIKSIIVFISITILALTIYTSCDSSTEPEDGPGRRDYVWTIDTIDPGPDYRTYGFNIWGATPNDIWMVGSADTRLYTTWHYDGNKWETVQLDGFVEGAGIWGFSSNDIWMGTSNNSIWHFDGNKWSLHTEFEYKDFDHIVLQSVHGATPTEVYAVGVAFQYNSDNSARVMAEYKNGTWKLVDLPEHTEHFEYVNVDAPSGNVFITSARYHRINTNEKLLHLYLYKDNELIEMANSEDYLALGNIGKKTYMTISNKIYTCENDSLKLFKDFSGTEFLSRILGRSEIDFFTANHPSDIGHYNGSDLITIFPINAGVNRGIIFENDFFMHAKDYEGPYYRDLIIHGKLK